VFLIAKRGVQRKVRSRLVTRLLWFRRRTEASVAEDRLTLSGVALVSVMKSSDLRNHYDAPACGFSTTLDSGASLATAR
jgi:hypothetical protein